MGLNEFVNARNRRSENTGSHYGVSVRLFVKSVGFETPDQVIEAITKTGKDPIDLLDQFVASLTTKNLAPNSINSYIVGVKSFLRFHKIKLDAEELKNRLVLPSRYEVSVDRAFEDEEIRSMLMRTDLKGKVLILVGLTTGARIGEISKLRISDIDFEANPPTITFQPSADKTRRGRTSFTTHETIKVISDFLGSRKSSDPQGWLFPKPKNALVPESGDSHEAQIRRLLIRCDLRTKEGGSRRYALHTHCLRKTFRTKCAEANVLFHVSESWMGHAIGLDRNYLRLNGKVMVQEWQKVEPYITYLSPPDPKTLVESSERLKSLELENLRLMKDSVDASKRMETLEDESKRLTLQYERQQKEIEKAGRLFQSLKTIRSRAKN
ncbi:site-specific integrase [Candidatus Bathyarchaeota archaeon]|nr:site-specific integrase [Candidatus Bathyarchaeota archaeon]